MRNCILNTAIVLLIFCDKIGAFNLNTKNTVVFSDPNPGSHSRGSYFGYAVAIYGSNSDPLVIVGAPRANVSRLSGIREPGAVYWCRLSGQCREWPIDNSRNGELHGIRGINQMIDGSWIGATISVENKPQPRVVVCAPRWINIRSGNHKLNGLCYYTVAMSPKAFEEPVQKILNLLTNRTNENGWNHNDDFRVATMGFSLYEFAEESVWNIMIGAPGCYGWSGTPILVTEKSSGEMIAMIPRTNKYYYTSTGYGVTSGFYFDNETRWYVASSPQVDDNMGTIQFFHYNGDNPVVIGRKIEGAQYEEYFGASVTSCDVDNDGRDDLIVGAPSWSDNGDEGRIYIISARRNVFERNWIDGKFEGARFGSSVVCLGDLDRDGYGDVAVGAPYEDKSGAVYIFNGGRYGLSQVPSQKILGKDFGRLSGFGLSISEPRDIDGNGYPDVAVGAYRSGHAVLFRAQPVIKVNISLSPVDSMRLNSDTTLFSVKFCGYYDGYRVPETLRVMKIFRIDETHNRASLHINPTSNGTYELPGIFVREKDTCEPIIVHLKNGTKTYPIVIAAALRLMNENTSIKKEISTIESKISLNFKLDCGPDDICHSNLTTRISTSLGEENKYTVGGEDTINISIQVENNQEPAYDTQLHIFLPEILPLTSLPIDCQENPTKNGTVEVIWSIENPLRHRATLKLEISMRQVEIESEDDSNPLMIAISLITQSRNVNDKKGIDSVIINLVVDATVAVTGQAKDTSYSYFSTSEEKKIGTIQFDHIYGVQKLGITPIQQAILIVLVPTHLRKSKNEIVEIARINATTVKFFDSINRNDNDYVCQIERVEEKGKKIMERDSNILTQSLNATLKNRALFLNCENVAIDCVNVTCLIDVPKESVNPSVIAELKLTIDFLLKDVPDDFTTSKDIIYFVSNGSAMITHPSRAGGKSGMRRNSTLVSTQFLGTPVSAPVASWVIAVSVLVGILLLALLIFALIKLGFFKRKHKEQLEELKADADKKGGLVIETSSSREFLDQD